VFSSDDDTSLLEVFPFAFNVQNTVTLTKDNLRMDLKVSHLASSKQDKMPFQALFHNYFHVPSATAKATGLKDITYNDKVSGGKLISLNNASEQGWNEVIDRVYQGKAPTVTITANDESGTVITLERSSTLPDTVLWNPGKEAADAMKDMQSDGWKEFVCAEPGYVDSCTSIAKDSDWTGSQILSYKQEVAPKTYMEGVTAGASAALAGSMGALGLAANKASKEESSQRTLKGVNDNKVDVLRDDNKGSSDTAKLSSEKATEKDESKSQTEQSNGTEKSDEKEEPKGDEKPKSEMSEAERDRAAAVAIQRKYRNYRGKREAAGQTLSSDARWGDAMGRVRMEGAAKDANTGDKNDTHSRWKRSGLMVGQLAGSPGTGDQSKDAGPVEGGPSLKPNDKLKELMNDDPEKKEKDIKDKPEGHDPEKTTSQSSETMIGSVPGANEDGKVDNIRSIAKKNQHGLKLIERWTKGAPAQEMSKVMEAQYWLEMVDRKHRYGANLKQYHQAWENDHETTDNFFKWLDEGRGKDMDVEGCPRDRLEREQITYLSAEQRANYVVDIKDGKLVWRHNGKYVDSTKGKCRDLGNGRGIVELGPEEQEAVKKEKEERLAAKGKKARSDSDSSSSSSSSDEDDDEEKDNNDKAAHYGGDENSSKKSNIFSWDAMLRKTIGENTWIYVYNSRHELFVGIKSTGKFQHSSFLYGGRVLSAGLIKVKNGTLTSLNPLSGHYRAGTAHFRYFVAALQDSGVDLEHVTLSKSLLLLRGLEMYGKFNKKIKGGDKKKKEKEEQEKSTEKDEKSSKQDASKSQEHHSFMEKLGLKSSH
jgi:hypothetical protein